MNPHGPSPTATVAGREPWTWDQKTVHSIISLVRAGKALTPTQWPAGNRVAVALSFDIDQETIPLSGGDCAIGPLSVGEFGARVGVPRILVLLEQFGARATMFVPAVSAMLHPDDVRAFAASGHEVALHGWIHERGDLLPEGVERELTLRAADVLEDLSGQRPVGLRTPSANVTPDTLSVIRELGLSYDSSLMADDEPYELVVAGERTGVVEVPMDWSRDDAAYFRFDRELSHRPYLSPRAWLSILIDEFEAALEAGGTFTLVCHPHIIGHRARMLVLNELLAHIRTHEGVWFATHADIAAACRPALQAVAPCAGSSQAVGAQIAEAGGLAGVR